MSSNPSKEFEEMRIKIASRRLQRRHNFRSKVKINAAAYASAAALHPGDNIARHINPISWHHGIYIGDGKVRVRARYGDGTGGGRGVLIATHAVIERPLLAHPGTALVNLWRAI